MPVGHLAAGAGLRLPPVRPSGAPVELTLDLRATPADKFISRLFGALERVAADVTLLVLTRDTPEYVGVIASAHQALRGRGYAADSARLPGGGQRIRVQRRREAPRPPRPELEPDTVYAPPPASPAAPITQGAAEAPSAAAGRGNGSYAAEGAAGDAETAHDQPPPAVLDCPASSYGG